MLDEMIGNHFAHRAVILNQQEFHGVAAARRCDWTVDKEPDGKLTGLQIVDLYPSGKSTKMARRRRPVLLSQCRQPKKPTVSATRQLGSLYPVHRQQKQWRATMRTKFFTTLAAAALLTVSSAAVALAEAPDVQASAAANYTAGANPSRNMSTGNSFAPNIGPSAHFHPHGRRGT
ncbi:MAG: hypothetical protein ACRED6_01025 [Stellaceae bacterium]